MPMEETLSGAPPQAPQLQSCYRQFETLKQEAKALINGMDDDAFNWRPAPERWSVGECLDHLNIVGSMLVEKVKPAIEQARAQQRFAEGPFEYGWLGERFVSAMQPSARRTFTAPKKFVPSSSSLSKTEVLERFMDLQDTLKVCVCAADGLDLQRIKVRSAAFPLLRLPLGAWFEGTAAHEERHLVQARLVIQHADFPHTH